MEVLSSHFILLHAIFHNVLYIHQPQNSTEALVCFDVKNNSAWIRMTPTTINHNISTFSTTIPNNTIRYKTRIKFQDATNVDLNWKIIKDAPELLSTDYYRPEAVPFLVYYITFCSSILILKCLIRIIKRKKCLLMLN